MALATSLPRESLARCARIQASRSATSRATGLVELAIAAVGVGLEDAGVVGQMRLGMLAGPIARVIEHGRRRRRSAEWLVVAHIDPDATGIGLAFGENGNGGVIPVQS